jgi:hypothetical protein
MHGMHKRCARTADQLVDKAGKTREELESNYREQQEKINQES